VTEGFHRVAWNLRYPAVEPWKPVPEEEEWMPPYSVLAAPGTYSVSMAKRVEGKLTDLNLTQSFEVVPHRDPAIPGATPEEALAFLRNLAALDRAVQGAEATIEETEVRLRGIKEALMRSTIGESDLDDEARTLERRLQDIKYEIVGSPRRENYGDPGPVSVSRRISVATMGSRYSMYGPTPTHRESAAIAEEQFAELRQALRQLIEVDLRDLERRLEAAGVPWTPGRGVPQP
jgi:hypothetical protein